MRERERVASKATKADRTLMGGWLARLVALAEDVRARGEDVRVAALLGWTDAEGVQLVRDAWAVAAHARASLVSRLAREIELELAADPRAYDHLEVPDTNARKGQAKGRGRGTRTRPRHEAIAEALAASVE